MILEHAFQLQQTGYYCGPAAVRVALSCRGQLVEQAQLAAELGTTTAGTDSSADVVRVLNARLGAGTYADRYIAGQTATAEQSATLRADVIAAIDAGYAVVANVAGTIDTLDGSSYSYPGGHYVTVVGYSDDAVRVADIAVREYWTTVERLAVWIATRGYAYPLVTAAPITEEDDMQTYQLAQSEPGAQIYLCDGMVSRPVAEGDLPHIRQLAKEGVFALAGGGEVRQGWYPGAFGPVPATVWAGGVGPFTYTFTSTGTGTGTPTP